MDPQQLIHKATLLLDLRGDTVGAETALRAAIETAVAEEDPVSAVQARVFLGELLVEANRSQECRPLLLDALAMAQRSSSEDQAAIEYECQRARTLLALPEWSFDEPRNVAVMTTTHVLRRHQPIVLVTHDEEDGCWQFHSAHPATSAEAMIVALSEVVEHDPTVASLANLPCGWRATRQDLSSPWKRERSTSNG
jgi:LmbE family N-acetylglucosaminyl deacetylase